MFQIELKLVSPIPPSVNHYLGYRAVRKGNRWVAVSYKTKESTKYQKEFCQYVQEEARDQGWKKSDNRAQHYYLDAVFYFPRIDMDANNYFKCMADAITDSGCVWIDDTQLCERVQGIFYDSENPRIEMTITPVDYIGIFGDISQLNNFRKRCIGCARYTRNCSLLGKAVAGKIQDEISCDNCKKFKKTKESI